MQINHGQSKQKVKFVNSRQHLKCLVKKNLYQPSEGEGQFTESTKAKGPNIPCASTMPSESSSESFFLNGQTTVHSHQKKLSSQAWMQRVDLIILMQI